MTNYTSGAASAFATHARSSREARNFPCASDFRIGNMQLSEGDLITAVDEGTELYAIHVTWREGAIARLTASDVNRLAGFVLIEQ